MAGPVAGGGGDELRRFRRLADLTAVATFLLIVVGGIVRVSESGLGCGPGGSGTEGWPLCGGQVIPFVGNENRVIEFSHRLLATVVCPDRAALLARLQAACASERWAFRGSLVAGVLVLAQAGLGGLTVEHGLAEELVAAHLGPRCCCSACCSGSSAKARSAGGGAENGDLATAGPRPEALRGDRGGAAPLRDRRRRLRGRHRGGGRYGGRGPNIAGAHLACGKQFPECGYGQVPAVRGQPA